MPRSALARPLLPPFLSFQLPTCGNERCTRDSILTLRINLAGKCDLHDRQKRDLELEGPCLLRDS